MSDCLHCDIHRLLKALPRPPARSQSGSPKTAVAISAPCFQSIAFPFVLEFEQANNNFRCDAREAHETRGGRLSPEAPAMDS